MNELRVSLPCGELSLEGMLSLPQGEGLFPGVVVCHPHPLMGGDMNNNVVVATSAALTQASIACLRFNFRGVGRSEGKFAQGIGEREDIMAALSFLEGRSEVNAARLGLCGYSFGSAVALPVAAEDERVQAVAGISPLSLTVLQHYVKPKLFLCGDRDEFIPSGELQQAIAKLPEPKRCGIIPGADHFWWGYEDRVASRVADFFSTAFE
jgi:hypothetical protein